MLGSTWLRHQQQRPCKLHPFSYCGILYLPIALLAGDCTVTSVKYIRLLSHRTHTPAHSRGLQYTDKNLIKRHSGVAFAKGKKKRIPSRRWPFKNSPLSGAPMSIIGRLCCYTSTRADAGNVSANGSHQSAYTHDYIHYTVVGCYNFGYCPQPNPYFSAYFSSGSRCICGPCLLTTSLLILKDLAYCSYHPQQS